MSGRRGDNGVARAPGAELSSNWPWQYSPGALFWGAAFILALTSLAGVATISRHSDEKLQEATRAATRTREVLQKVGELSTSLTEVESAARSFAISGKQSHLDPFYRAAKEVPERLNELKVLVRGDLGALGSVVEAEPLIMEHLKVMKDMVDLGNKNLFRGSSQRKLTDQGNTVMEQIRTAVNNFEKTQRAQLDRQQVTVGARSERVTAIGVAICILAAALVTAFGVFSLFATLRRAKAEEKLQRLLGSMPDALVIVNGEGKVMRSNPHTAKLFGYTERELDGASMALLVPERLRQAQRQYYSAFFLQRNGSPGESTLELCGLHKDGREFPIEISTKPLPSRKGLLVTSAIRDISERKEVEKRIWQLNHELQDRAAELEAANKELEAFTYSVSHDLRSPLHNIDGFSQILVDEYANRLDSDGRDYVQRLRASCQHMEEIIDALLALSSMARHELLPESVDLTAQAKAIATELQQQDLDRVVDWGIAEGMVVRADPRLMRVVLENLLGNAWKFTSKRPRARIEFGALPQCNGERTYFVRDDGAGFDMERAGKLFTPFKRLHDQSQFRGTGIGLATVQRVIQRHHGRIWAEAAVDRGATFCFTLGHHDSAPLNPLPELERTSTNGRQLATAI